MTEKPSTPPLRRGGRAVATTVAVLIAAAAVTSVGAPASASGGDATEYDPTAVTQTPVESTTYYEVTNTDHGTQLWAASISDDGATMAHSAVGAAVASEYNAITYDNRSGKGALYGARLVTDRDGDAGDGQSSHLVQIDPSTGAVRDLGVSFWLDHADRRSSSSITAAMDDDGRIYFGTHDSPDMVVFDVDTGTLEHLTFTEPLRVSDTTWAEGFLWGRENAYGDIVRIDPATLTVTTYPSPKWMPQGDPRKDDGPTGGMFTFSNGNLGFIFNGGTTQFGTGGVTQQVAIGDAVTPDFSLVATYASPAARGTDGAVAIGQLPVDLSLEKTAERAAIAVGERVTWTVTVTNRGKGDSSGYVVTDALPAGLVDVRAEGAEGVTIDDGEVSVQGGPLAAGASRTHAFSTRAEAAGIFVNNARVVGNEFERDLLNNTDDDVVTAALRAQSTPTPTPSPTASAAAPSPTPSVAGKTPRPSDTTTPVAASAGGGTLAKTGGDESSLVTPALIASGLLLAGVALATAATARARRKH